jgi:hypothetical protein
MTIQNLTEHGGHGAPACLEFPVLVGQMPGFHAAFSLKWTSLPSLLDTAYPFE